MVRDDRVRADRAACAVDLPVPAEPPARVHAELLWRVAALLHREHGLGWEGRCRCCHQPWPCSGRRLAELGLRQAGAGG